MHSLIALYVIFCTPFLIDRQYVFGTSPCLYAYTQFGVMMSAKALGQMGPAFSDIVKAQVGANKLFAIQV